MTKQESLDNALEELIWGQHDDERLAIKEAKASIAQAIEGIIGEDDSVAEQFDKHRNQLRAQQRKRLQEWLRGEDDE